MKFIHKALNSIILCTSLLSCATFIAAAQSSNDGQFVTQSCPDDFYDLPIFPGAKLCQIFAQELPASMIYHANADQQTTQSFYETKLGPATSVKLLKGRILLEYDDSNKIIVISKDGDGSQVDVLVKTS